MSHFFASPGAWRLDERSKPWGIGCTCCHLLCQTPFADFNVSSADALQLQNFKAHAKSKMHKAVRI